MVLILLIPLPLFFAQTVYGVGGFTAWVVIGMIWCFAAAFTVVLYPLWESRVALTEVAAGVTKVYPSSHRSESLICLESAGYLPCPEAEAR